MQNDGSTSAFRQFLRNKWVRLILIIDAVAIIAIIGVIIWNTTKTATINFSIAPVDAKIQIDGQGEYYNGSYQVHPGNHTITISHDGLISKTFTMDLKSGYDTTLTTFLKGEGDNFDFYTLRDNYESFQKLSKIASAGNNLTTDEDPSASDFIQNFERNYELYQTILPINYSNQIETILPDGSPWYVTTRAFNIERSSSSECQKTLCLKAVISILDDNNFISEILQEKGFELNFCEVKYEDHL